MSGCLTKIYLGQPKIEEQTNYLSDDSPILGAINPTTIPVGGTWGTVRGIINTNFSNINGSLDSIEVTTAKHEADIDTLEQGYLDHADSLAVHRTAINLRALKSDLTAKLTEADSDKYVTPLALSTGLAGKQDVFTLKTINSQTLFGTGNIVIEGGEGGTMTWPASAGIPLYDGASGWGTSITNNSTEWNKAGVVGNGTAPPYFDGTSDGGQVLTFYGDNGFWTALQGGAPVANRSYRLPIAALPGAGTTSLMNIDEYGNMGFAFNGIPATLTATELGYSDGVTSSIQNQINAKVNVIDTAAMLASYKRKLDSIVNVLKDSVNIETLLQIDFDTDTLAKLSDVRSLAGSGVVGVTLNSGTLTLTGSGATADDVTFYTNGDGQYNLPSGGGNLTIQSQVQAWIADSLDVLRTADSDTIPLFVFGLGSGHSSDTAVFNNGRLAGAFYNSGSDTLYVTELRGVLVEGTGTETIDVQVSWDVNMKDATPTNLNTTALTVTNMTTGTVDTSFDNNGIPPGMWIWCTLSGASANNKPTMLTLTMTGYRRNRSY